MIRWWIIGVQSILLILSLFVMIGLGIGWYISYNSWQEYIQPREQSFYDGIFFSCRFFGGRLENCQDTLQSFYYFDAFEDKAVFGMQDWFVTQGKEAGEVQ